MPNVIGEQPDDSATCAIPSLTRLTRIGENNFRPKVHFIGGFIQMIVTRLAMITLLCGALGACASVIEGASESIAITTPPTSGATCLLSSGQGSWTVVSPGAVTVARSKDDVQIRCAKPGWQDGVATIPSNFEGWTVGNLLIGGLIGLGVDAATGAINEYPHAFQVPMTKADAPAENQPPSQPGEKAAAPTS